MVVDLGLELGLLVFERGKARGDEQDRLHPGEVRGPEEHFLLDFAQLVLKIQVPKLHNVVRVPRIV